jgi:plastocyanin
VVTAASGDGDGSTGGGSTGGGYTDGGSTGGGSRSGVSSSVAASIGDRVFSPATIRVAVGGSVTWTNDDDDEHTVTASDGSFDSGVMGQGGTHPQRFTTAGTFSFLCVIHPEMQGEVTVVGAGGAAPAPAATPIPTPRPAATPTAAPSRPTDGGVPMSATVEMRDFAFGRTTVTIADGGTVTFANTGAAPHTATADDGTFDTGMVGAGSSASIRVKGPGSIDFVCTFHPEMRGTLEVVAAGASGSAGGASPPRSPSPSPSPTASVEPEATAAGVTSGGGTTTGGGDTGSGTAPSATAGQRRGLDSLVGIIVGVTLVSIAAALFARTIGGTVRRPG